MSSLLLVSLPNYLKVLHCALFSRCRQMEVLYTLRGEDAPISLPLYFSYWHFLSPAHPCWQIFLSGCGCIRFPGVIFESLELECWPQCSGGLTLAFKGSLEGLVVLDQPSHLVFESIHSIHQTPEVVRRSRVFMTPLQYWITITTASLWPWEYVYEYGVHN